MRQHSTPSDASESVRTGYNSDARVVAGAWLFVLVWYVQKESESDTAEQQNGYHDNPSSKHEEHEISLSLPDPEHLPPVNTWEKASNVLYYIPRIIRSELSVLAFAS